MIVIGIRSSAVIYTMTNNKVNNWVCRHSGPKIERLSFHIKTMVRICHNICNQFIVYNSNSIAI